MPISSCKTEMIPYLKEMTASAMQTYKTKMETGFSIGLAPDGAFHLEKVKEDDYLGLNIPRPLPPDKPFLHFHTHVPDDMVNGLSGGDTLFPFFSEKVYPYHCVAATGYQRIYCYRPNEVATHPEYNKRIQEQKDFSRAHALTVLSKCPKHHKQVSDFLLRNDLKNLIKYERKNCPEAANVMRRMVLAWNDFIPKTKCAEFPIKED